MASKTTPVVAPTMTATGAVRCVGAGVGVGGGVVHDPLVPGWQTMLCCSQLEQFVLHVGP